MIEVRVDYRTAVTTWTTETLSVPDPAGSGSLASQGFWGAMFTPGGIRTNGDRYGPADIGYHAIGNPSDDATNPDYDGQGYDYLVELGGTVESASSIRSSARQAATATADPSGPATTGPSTPKATTVSRHPTRLVRLRAVRRRLEPVHHRR